jgi:hypothetical protein
MYKVMVPIGPESAARGRLGGYMPLTPPKSKKGAEMGNPEF